MDQDTKGMNRHRDAAEEGPVIRYVNCLLIDMIKKTEPVLDLRRSMPLPTPDTDGSQVPDSFSLVENRLKVMCDLDPVTYQKPVDGRFRIKAIGRTFMVRLHFDDQADDPGVRLTADEVQLQNKRSKPPEELVP